MRKIFFILLFCSNLALAQTPAQESAATTIKLPEPDLNGKISLEQTIENRRSIRQFTAEPLTVKQVGQLCWAAQGITDPNKGLHAAPSPGALYPMSLYVVLSDGLYLFSPQNNSLEKQIDGDIRPMLRTAAFGQKVVLESPCTFIIVGSIKKIEAQYRGRGEKFAYLEAGHIAENINLQAVALGLGSAPVDSFAPKSVAGLCRIADDLEVLYLICAGNPAEKPVLQPAIAAAPLAQPPPASTQENLQNKRVVIIVPNGYYNDREFFGVQDNFLLVGIRPVVASIATGEIKGIERNVVTATILVRDIKVDNYDAFVFIGGPGTRDYFNNPDILGLVRAADKANKILAAIGTAPAIFAYAGIVNGRNVASFVAQRVTIISAGGIWKNSSLEISGNMITANGPEAAITTTGGQDASQRFGVAIVDMLRLPSIPRAPAPKTGAQSSQPLRY